METIINTERVPIKLWIPVGDIDDDTMKQVKDLANLPFAFSHIAIMPDTHVGYGMPIGAVLATKGVIVPNAVGVDIGCGMCSLRTSLKEVGKEDLKKILEMLRKTIPVGFDHHKEKQDEGLMPERDVPLPMVDREYESALCQIGTLGGGNHFVEIQKGSDGFIWIMIHSGSRNLGLKVANHYHDIARNKYLKEGETVPEDLAYLPAGTEDYDNYWNEMNYCIHFALANRKLMMERVKTAFREIFPDITFSNFINKPHNFAAEEEHFGEMVLVHRKGATRAKKDEWGMIPGSQGTLSYLVKGKGNPDSFESCSHGSGRVMSRAKARKTLNLKAEQRALDEKGILHGIRHKEDLDEAPSSYKDLTWVMDLQKDLVDIEIELRPLAVMKG
jgi:tRNA-splicing ligase RtcB